MVRERFRRLFIRGYVKGARQRMQQMQRCCAAVRPVSSPPRPLFVVWLVLMNEP